MKFYSIIIFGLIATATSKTLIKRNSAYGDEVITPAPYLQSTELPYNAPGLSPVEHNYVETKQDYAPLSEPKVEQSGYKKKRSSGYGDELVTPEPVTASSYYIEESVPTTAPEYVPVTEKNNYNAGYGPSPQPSGY
uniref:Conserved secreted protein n=1 Tax=Strongyloides stercoralis TaxID=6248 RepID=A0A0K0EF07_STRER